MVPILGQANIHLPTFQRNIQSFGCLQQRTSHRGFGIDIWTSIHQAPAVSVPGLDNRGVWQRNDDALLEAISSALEKNFQGVLADLHGILSKPWAHDTEFVAYPHLVGSGTWYKWSLFRIRRWNVTLCTVAKSICSTLKPLLPSKGIIGVN